MILNNKVERKVPYAKDYQTCCDEAKEEQINNERPELVNYLESIDDYDVIYIGSPIYCGTMPQPMFTQLEKLNFKSDGYVEKLDSIVYCLKSFR